MLKVDGALLNHIRPEHLLQYNDYLFYLKILPAKTLQYLNSSVLKISQSKFQYISLESWTSLIYQMLKIYFLSKINLKALKNSQIIPQEKFQVPEYIDGSNFLSTNESLILHWF